MKKSFKKALAGDEVTVVLPGGSQQGVLLESYEAGIILLKLSSGYNIGFYRSDVKEIKLIAKGAAKKVEKVIKQSGNKPIIDIILTGGTISSKLDPLTGGVSWLLEEEEFFSIYPEIFAIADIRVKSPFMKASENMAAADWIKIAKLAGKSLNDSQVKGVIISHGTDTLHYTASALSFMLGKLNKPVVLTYSQRSADRGSSDSRMNLLCSAHMALSDVAQVMLVGHATMNDDYCYALQGNKCRKLHSSRRDAFKPVNCKPFAKVWPEGKVELLRHDYRKRNKDKVVVDGVFDSKVGLFKIYPGCDPAIISYYQKNCKGLVIEGTGFGHVISEGKTNFIPTLRQVIKKGLLVYMTTQTIFGKVNPLVYSPGRKLAESGVVYLEDMLAETALVKLGWVLGHKHWRGTITTRDKMLENISGEFNNLLGNEFL